MSETRWWVALATYTGQDGPRGLQRVGHDGQIRAGGKGKVQRNIAARLAGRRRDDL